jgi:hypothetical protein
MSNIDSEFDDMTAVTESVVPQEKQGTMWISAPARNSVELELSALMNAELCFQHEIEFIDDCGNRENLDERGKVVADSPTPEDDQLAAVRSQIAAFWLRHIALARALGAGAYWPEYEAACQREGMIPINGG